MRAVFVFFLLLGSLPASLSAQELALKKGIVLDSLALNDSIARQITLYLPKDFDPSRRWPVVFLCDTDGEMKTKLRYLTAPAEKNGYILASSHGLRDSSSLTEKILLISSSLEKLKGLLPLDLNGVYTTGYDKGGQLATIVPSMIRGVTGVLTVASGLPNLELLNPREPFDYVGIMGRADFQYLGLLSDEEILDQRKVPATILYHGEGHQWPDLRYLDLGMQTLTLMRMKKGTHPMDSTKIGTAFQDYQDLIRDYDQAGQAGLAFYYASEGEDIFKGLVDTDWFRMRKKEIRKSSAFKEQKRDWEAVRLNEILLSEEYNFYLEEDVMSFNLDNLGWWNHQMGKITKYKNSTKREEQLLGQRLEGYLNALVDEYIEISERPNPDYDGLILLNMLKTITAPFDYDSYLQVISLTAKYGDSGTANYYLEELLKKGYSDADQLYSLPNTGLLKISPEYNALIDQYLGQARYPIE
jgi:hypothetical protein